MIYCWSKNTKVLVILIPLFLPELEFNFSIHHCIIEMDNI